MSHEITEKIINKRRIVAAILSELSSARAIIFCTNSNTEESFQVTIHSEFSSKFSESILEFTGIDSNVSSAHFETYFMNHRISFETTKKQGHESHWNLPENIKLTDLRQERRWKFADNQYSCEIIGKKGSVYGFASDVNKDCIAIDMDTVYDLSIGKRYKLIIRMVNTNKDVFFIDSKLLLLTGNDSESVRGIFEINQNKKTRDSEFHLPRAERLLVDNRTITLGGAPFADYAESVDFSVENISTGGMTVKELKSHSDYSLIPGMIVKSDNPKISFMVIWANGNKVGIRPHLQNRDQLSAWYKYLDEVNPPDDRKLSVSRQEFADLLTFSGLLKGSRREPFGKSISEHLITTPEIMSPLLVQRFYSIDEDSKTDMHVSAKRISDMSWFFGDGATITEQAGKYNHMLDSVTTRLTNLATSSDLLPKYITGIWHENIKSTAKWGIKLAESENTNLFKSINVNISRLNSNRSKWFCTPINHVTADQRQEIAKEFNPDLFESITCFDGRNPILNSELSKFGPYHRTETKAVSIDNNNFVIAHRIFTYGIWSNTGVTNAVFVLVPNSVKHSDLLESLSAIKNDAISFGTNDLLVIFEEDYPIDKLDDKIFPKDRYFTFIVHNLLLNGLT